MRNAHGCKCRLNRIFNFEIILSYNLITCSTSVAEWLRHPSHTMRSLTNLTDRVGSNLARTDLIVRKSVSLFVKMWKGYSHKIDETKVLAHNTLR